MEDFVTRVARLGLAIGHTEQSVIAFIRCKLPPALAKFLPINFKNI